MDKDIYHLNDDTNNRDMNYQEQNNQNASFVNWNDNQNQIHWKF